MKKDIFEPISMELQVFVAEDIVTTSPDTDGSGNGWIGGGGNNNEIIFPKDEF